MPILNLLMSLRILSITPQRNCLVFLKDEMAKLREHELKMLQVITSPMPNTSFAPPQHGYQRNHQPGETPNNYPQWQEEYWPTRNHRPSTSAFDNFYAGASNYYQLNTLLKIYLLQLSSLLV